MKAAFYEVLTGRFVGKTYEGPETWLGINTPDGCAAWVYDDAPPTPSVDAVIDGALVRGAIVENWIVRRDAVARGIYALIKTAEEAQSRPLREILAAQLAGGPANTGDLDVFHALKARIDTERVRYNAVLAAGSEADLDAITQLQPVY